MDLVGPYAWSTECPLEKFFRDAKIYQLFEGTAEIQRMVISRMQAREYAERLGYGAEVAAAAMAAEPGQGARSPRNTVLMLGGVQARTATPTRWTRGAATAVAGCGSRWRSTSRCSRWRRSAGSSPARWRCSPTPATCSPTSARSALRSPRRASPSRPAGGRRTFGYQRSEVLAALVNGLLLVAVGVGVAIAAIGGSATRRRSTAAACWRSACSAWRETSPPTWCWPGGSARTSTSRGCCATAPPTRSAPSAWSSRAPSSGGRLRRSSTRSSASLIAA